MARDFMIIVVVMIVLAGVAAVAPFALINWLR